MVNNYNHSLILHIYCLRRPLHRLHDHFYNLLHFYKSHWLSACKAWKINCFSFQYQLLFLSFTRSVTKNYAWSGRIHRDPNRNHNRNHNVFSYVMGNKCLKKEHELFKYLRSQNFLPRVERNSVRYTRLSKFTIIVAVTVPVRNFCRVWYIDASFRRFNQSQSENQAS